MSDAQLDRYDLAILMAVAELNEAEIPADIPAISRKVDEIVQRPEFLAKAEAKERSGDLLPLRPLPTGFILLERPTFGSRLRRFFGFGSKSSRG